MTTRSPRTTGAFLLWDAISYIAPYAANPDNPALLSNLRLTTMHVSASLYQTNKHGGAEYE